MIRRALRAVLVMAALGVRAGAVDWPPRLGEPYPDLTLIDQTGQSVRLSSFKGSVILLEPVGMNCSACQAFSGAHRKGAYGGITPQEDLPSLEELLSRYGNGVSLSNPGVVHVQLLLTNLSNGVPTPEDAKAWAQHFGLDRARNQIVLAGTAELQAAGNGLIPGFQLIDKRFILRADAAGHNPHHNLYTELLPMVQRLIEDDR